MYVYVFLYVHFHADVVIGHKCHECSRALQEQPVLLIAESSRQLQDPLLGPDHEVPPKAPWSPHSYVKINKLYSAVESREPQAQEE